MRGLTARGEESDRRGTPGEGRSVDPDLALRRFPVNDEGLRPPRHGKRPELALGQHVEKGERLSDEHKQKLFDLLVRVIGDAAEDWAAILADRARAAALLSTQGAN